MYQNYKSEEFEKNTVVVNSKDFAKEENSLLRLMELSSIQFYEKKYLDSLETLQQAQSLADVLYTKSIRQLILSGFLGDEVKSFYGKIHERSALFNLQILNFLYLYSGKEFLAKKAANTGFERQSIQLDQRREYLLKAKAVVLAWSSFYDTLERDSSESFFSKDYYQKILSAHIHEELGTKSDRNIALILYENTLKDFERLVALYPSFNLNHELATQSYLNRQKIGKVQLTDKGRKLKEFLVFKVLFLTKKISKGKLSRKIKLYAPTKETITKIKSNKNFISIFFSNQFISPIKEKMISYNLNTALDKIEDQSVRNLVEVIGVSTLTYFTLGTLGLPLYAFSRDGATRTYVYTDLSAANSLVKNIGIDIKVPYKDSSLNYVEFPLMNKAERVQTFSLLNSYSEKAAISTQEFANKYYDAVGVKIAIKYLVAIVGAYTTYNTLKKAESPFASILALTQFLASSRVIAATQSVDTRGWIGMPSNTHFVSVDAQLLKDSKDLTIKLDESTQLRVPLSTNRSLIFLSQE